MSSREDIIEVPIEIRISDLAELNKLIQQLEEAKGKVDTARTSRRTMPSGGSGAPIQRDDDSVLSIFGGGNVDRDVLPLKTRDTKSKQAVTRGDSFQDLQKKVESLQQTNNSLIPFITQVGSTFGFTLPPFVSAGINLARNVKSTATSKAPIIMPTTTFGGKFAKLGINLGKTIPFIGAGFVLYDFLINELPSIINEQLYGAGKRMDRRFKRVLENEVASGTDRETKAQIAQGYRSVITTSFDGARGAAFVGNSKQNVLRGENIYNKSNEYMYGVP